MLDLAVCRGTGMIWRATRRRLRDWKSLDEIKSGWKQPSKTYTHIVCGKCVPVHICNAKVVTFDRMACNAKPVAICPLKWGYQEGEETRRSIVDGC